MTLVSDIISGAFREGNLIAVGESPTANEEAEALSRLQSVVFSTLGNDIGYLFEDWSIVSSTSIRNPSNFPLSSSQASSYYVRPQTRLLASLSSPTEVKLDPMPQDGQRVSVVDVLGNFSSESLTLNGNGRNISGASSVVLSSSGTKSDFFYRADLGEWVEIGQLSTSDDMPFPEEFDDYFVISLAMRVDPRYGITLSAEGRARFLEQQQQIVDRYSQSRVRGAGARKVSDRSFVASSGES